MTDLEMSAFSSEAEMWQAIAEALEAKNERLRYVLEGVRGAIQTGRNEPLMIWKDQIDIVLDDLKTPTHETGPLSDSYGPIAGGDT